MLQAASKSAAASRRLLCTTPTPFTTAFQTVDSSFESKGVDSALIGKIGKLKIQRPTAVQSSVLPILAPADFNANVPDVMFHAPTGTGKTLAYLLPVLSSLSRLPHRQRRQTAGVVMVPTRELALQIAAIATVLGQRPTKKRRHDALSRLGGALKGGGVTSQNYSAVEAAVEDAARSTQLDWSVQVAKGEISAGELAGMKREPPNLLVGTPQALNSLVPQHVGLGLTGYVVLDEIDSLLLPGLKPHAVDLLRAVRRITRRREAANDSLSQYTPLRTVLCGAYPSSAVLDFAQSWLRTGYKSVDLNADGSLATHTGNPGKRAVGAAGKLPPHVQHSSVECSSSGEQLSQLCTYMRSGAGGGRVPRALVFANSTADVDQALEALQASGVKAAAFSNSTGYQLRRRAMRRMEEGALNAIVCTDMLARGIDIPRLTHVVNLGAPTTPQAYYHRAGRVGRLRPSAADRPQATPKSGHVLTITQNAKDNTALQLILEQLGVQCTPSGAEDR